MSLRDYFAGQALAGIMTMDATSLKPILSAEECVQIADALIKELAK